MATYDVEGTDGEGRPIEATVTKRPGCTRGCLSVIALIWAICTVLGTLIWLVQWLAHSVF